MKIAIVGGSVAGCVAAIYLARAGHDGTVYERTPGPLTARGVVVGMVIPIFDRLVADGLLPDSTPRSQGESVQYVARDQDTGGERFLGRVAMPWVNLNWSDLYAGLRGNVPDGLVHSGHRVERVTASGADSAEITVNGATVSADLVVLADGYQSLSRDVISPSTPIEYRDLALVRGLIPATAAAEYRKPETQITRVAYPGGHGIGVTVPGPDGATAPESRQLMWGFYLRVPENELAQFAAPAEATSSTRANSLSRLTGDHRASMRAHLEGRLPDTFEDLVAHTEVFHLQPVFEVWSSRYRNGRICAIGDAGSVHAPFAGSGVLKAINSASTLSAALEGAGGDVDGALSAWDAAQIEAAHDSQREAHRLTSVLIDDIPDVFTPDVPAVRDWLSRLAPGATWTETL